MMAYEFKTTRRIEFAETDMAGIVHFSNFFRMMEATEHAFFRAQGLTVHGHDPVMTTGWPRVSATCDYRAPLRFEEEVEIHLLVAEMRSRSIRYAFTFQRLPDRHEVARGEVVAVCASVEKTTGKLVAVPIPDAVRAVIQAAPTKLLHQGPPA